MSAHHCTLFLVCSHQTGHLQVRTFRMPFRSAGPWKRSQGGRPHCNPGPMAFLASWSCLEGGPLPRARRPELVPAPAAGFSGPGNRSEGLPVLGCPSPPVSTQASFPKFFQSRELSLPLPGVCRSGLPRRLLLLPSKVDLGCRNNPGIERGQLSISGDTDHLRVARERHRS